jgi:hypothetical protein
VPLSALRHQEVGLPIFRKNARRRIAWACTQPRNFFRKCIHTALRNLHRKRGRKILRDLRRASLRDYNERSLPLAPVIQSNNPIHDQHNEQHSPHRGADNDFHLHKVYKIAWSSPRTVSEKGSGSPIRSPAPYRRLVICCSGPLYTLRRSTTVPTVSPGPAKNESGFPIGNPRTPSVVAVITTVPEDIEDNHPPILSGPSDLFRQREHIDDYGSLGEHLNHHGIGRNRRGPNAPHPQRKKRGKKNGNHVARNERKTRTQTPWFPFEERRIQFFIREIVSKVQSQRTMRCLAGRPLPSERS